MWQQITAVFIVLALLASMLFLLRRSGLAKFSRWRPRAAGRSGEIRILDRTLLTAQHTLFLIQVRSELMLIGVSPSGCTQVTALRGLPDPAERENDECASA